MVYREASPGPALAPYVLLYWDLEGAAAGPEWIFPDGHMEMIWHYRDPFHRAGRGGWKRQPRSILAGQIEQPLCVAPDGAAGATGVRFRPFGARAFLPFPAHEARGLVEALDSFLPTPELREMEERIALASGFPARVALIESFLRSRLRPAAPPPHGVSPRQYRRRFLDAVGVGPKTFDRIQRFQRTLRALGGGAPADAALDAGYFDQAHMIRDFREFAGMTPGQYLRVRRGETHCPFFPIAAGAPRVIFEK